MHRYIFALQNTRPTNATYGYDFRETSAASHAVVVQKVRKADFEDKNYSGIISSCNTVCSDRHHVHSCSLSYNGF